MVDQHPLNLGNATMAASRYYYLKNIQMNPGTANNAVAHTNIVRMDPPLVGDPAPSDADPIPTDELPKPASEAVPSKKK